MPHFAEHFKPKTSPPEFPSGAPEFPLSISNIDHEIPEGAEDALRSGHIVIHPAWDHWGQIWFADGQFHERVMQYGSIVGTMSAPYLKVLLIAVNEKYGYE